MRYSSRPRRLNDERRITLLVALSEALKAISTQRCRIASLFVLRHPIGEEENSTLLVADAFVVLLFYGFSCVDLRETSSSSLQPKQSILHRLHHRYHRHHHQHCRRPEISIIMGNTHDTEIARIEADYIHTKYRTTEDYRWGYANERGPTVVFFCVADK